MLLPSPKHHKIICEQLKYNDEISIKYVDFNEIFTIWTYIIKRYLLFNLRRKWKKKYIRLPFMPRVNFEIHDDASLVFAFVLLFFINNFPFWFGMKLALEVYSTTSFDWALMRKRTDRFSRLHVNPINRHTNL